MSQIDWTAILNLGVLIAIALLQWRNNRTMREVQVDVRKVELATNSLQDKMIAAKDAEVIATAAAQHAIGLAAGRKEQKAEDKRAK